MEYSTMKKIDRRQFGKLAGLSAASLMLPWSAQSFARENEKAGVAMSPLPAPAPGKNIHPLLAKRDQKAILARIQGLMKRDGIGALVIVKPENIAYATGYMSKFAFAAGVPAGAQAAAVIPASGNAQLFMNLMESDDASRMTNDVEVSPMPGFVFIDDGTEESRAEKDPALDPLVTVKTAVKIAKDVAGPGKIGTELGMLTWAFKGVMEKELGADRLADCSGLMYESRLIKFPWEIDMLRLTAQHTERWMARVARELKPGMNAMVFDQLCNVAAWEEDTENSMSIVGYQTAIGPYWGIGLAPRNYVIQEGDVCRIDGRRDTFWLH
jgi:Xaa-Pro dipeptidase